MFLTLYHREHIFSGVFYWASIFSNAILLFSTSLFYNTGNPISHLGCQSLSNIGNTHFPIRWLPIIIKHGEHSYSILAANHYRTWGTQILYSSHFLAANHYITWGTLIFYSSHFLAPTHYIIWGTLIFYSSHSLGVGVILL